MSGSVVVVGGGFGALEIALALRKQDRSIRITVISTETQVVYRPWLIRLAGGGPQPPVVPFANLLASAGASHVVGRVLSADLNERRVRVDSGAQIQYDQLVVATGAQADRGRVPGAREHALFPCDLDDAGELATHLSEGVQHVAIVFGWERPGPGLEYAAWIAARRPGIRVTAIDGDGTMDRRYGEKATAWVRALFAKRAAQLVCEGAVERIGDGFVELSGSSIAADLIAMVAPLQGSTEWLPHALLDDHGMLRVDAAMAAAEAGVFGIGDVVSVPDGYRLPPALRSIQATAAGVARNVAGAVRDAAPQAVLRPGQSDIMLPDLAGAAVLVRDRRLVLRGRLPLLIRSAGERRYLRSRSMRAASE